MGVQMERRDRPGWMTPPRLRTVNEADGERRATWLELFFDLVFVVAITELAQTLVGDQSVGGFLRFAALFVPVYVAWQGFSFYADRFDTDDLLFRLAIFAAMLAIAAMAVQIGDVARGAHSAGFALAYIVLRSLLLALYARAWRAVPEARPLVRLYGLGYACGVALWVVSLAFPTPWRYVVWVIAQTVELSLPPLSTQLHRRVPTSGSHVPERWALFTLIVIGESVAAVALTTAGAQWRLDSAIAAMLGFAAVVAIWWLYFDRQASVVLRGGAPSVVIYSYAHLPLLMALGAISAGVRLLIERAGEAELGIGAATALLGGVVLYLGALVGTRLVAVHGAHRWGLALKLGAAVALLSLLVLKVVLPPLALAGGLAGVLALVVFVERAFLLPREAFD